MSNIHLLDRFCIGRHSFYMSVCMLLYTFLSAFRRFYIGCYRFLFNRFAHSAGRSCWVERCRRHDAELYFSPMNDSSRRIASLHRIDELNQRIAFQNDPLMASRAAKTVPKEPKTLSRRPRRHPRPSKEGPSQPEKKHININFLGFLPSDLDQNLPEWSPSDSLASY